MHIHFLHVQSVAAILEAYSCLDNTDWCCLRDAALVSLSLDSGARWRALRNFKVDVVQAALRAPEQKAGGPAYTAYSISKKKVAKLRFFVKTASFLDRLLPKLTVGC